MKKIIITLIAVLALSMSAFAQGGTTGSLTWKIENNTLTISGEGAIPDFTPTISTPWVEYAEVITAIVIENGITRIGELSFAFLDRSISVTIPNSVTNIGVYSFYCCTSLPSIIIHGGVTKISEGAFSSCSNLVSIDVDSNNNNYASEDGVLFDKNKNVLICCPGGKTDNYAIPNSVIHIEADAFAGCESLISVTIPNSVTDIGDGSFWYCKNLVLITLPNNLTSIGAAAFFHCESLPSITIPNGVTRIENRTFSDCTSLTSITLPNNLTSIGDEGFSWCTSLISITIPNSVTNIGSEVFFRCTSLNLITNLNPVPVAINANVFEGVNKSACTLEVPINSVSAYENANVWKEFNIVGVEVGVDELRITNYELRIYPNPTIGKVYIETESEIKVYNLQGEFLQETFGYQVDLSDYPKGVYLLQINGRLRKVVKQ